MKGLLLALGGHGHGLGVAGQRAVQNIKDQFLTSLVTRGIERQSRLCSKYRLQVEKQYGKKRKGRVHLCPLALSEPVDGSLCGVCAGHSPSLS